MDKQIIERDGKWHVGTTSFDSQHAAQLYLESRALGANFSVMGALKILPWYIKAGFILLVVTSCNAILPRAARNTAAPPSAASDTDRLMRKAESFATLINLNSQLCARVTHIEHLHGSFYNVSCVRYRDGTGSATYEVNLDTGQAK